MIHKHIKSVAIELDEVNLYVRLPEDLSHENESFTDGDGLEAGWLRNYWQELFKLKIGSLRLGSFDNQKVLDVCCGRGFLGEYILNNSTAHVTFCDLSQNQLNEINQRIKNPASQFDIVKADISNLPFEGDVFDVVIGNSFLHHIQNIPMVLRELRRVVKKGGYVIFLHEPSGCANYFESFPLSIFKNTSSNEGYTDLWQFDPQNLLGVFKNEGFDAVDINGSGLLSSVLLNWYFILLGKAGVTSKYFHLPALYLRVFLYPFDSMLRSLLPCEYFPSLAIRAKKIGPAGRVLGDKYGGPSSI